MNLAHSPLLPQIKTVLGRMGYAPVAGDAALFMKQARHDRPLAVDFYRVSEREVQKIGVLPVQKKLSHAEFLTKHARHLFP